MTDRFGELAAHLAQLLPLDPSAREDALSRMPDEDANELRALLQFEHATLDLSLADGVDLACRLLAEPAPQEIGRWRVLSLLGRGGMGSVYLVERSELGVRQQAACKLGYQRLEAEDRLGHEAGILLDLRHPNIATVLDFGRTDANRPWLAAEHVDGDDLLTWCESRKALLDQRLALFEEVLSAVAYAHERLVLHQDLKPANILVDEQARPRVIDFGLATLLGAGMDSPVLGYTPAYASPEQKRGERLGVRSDVYSLGVTLRALSDGIPGRGQDDLRRVIDHACAERPDARYATAREFLDDVRAIRERRPISLRAQHWGYRAGRLILRHPVPVALSALVLLSMIAGMHAFAWQAQRAEASAQAARASATSAEAVRDFLIEDIIGDLNPGDADFDPERSVSEVIDRAAAAVDERFAGNPESAAAVHSALSSMYRSRGLYEKALAHAESSARLYGRTLGEAHELTLLANYHIVRALTATQDFARATELIELSDALAAERLEGPTRLALASAVARALLEEQQLRGGTALEAYRRVVALQPVVAPEDTTMASFARSGIAEAHLRLGQYQEAIRFLEKEPAFEVSDAHKAGVERKLARAHRALGDFDTAERHALEALALNRKTVGNDDYNTFMAGSTLAYIRKLKGDCPGAIETQFEVVEGLTRVYGGDKQASLLERGNLGGFQFECGQRQLGLENTLAAIRDLRANYGTDHYAASIFAEGGALYLAQMQRFEEAAAMLESVNPGSKYSDEAKRALALLQERASLVPDSELTRRVDDLVARMQVAEH